MAQSALHDTKTQPLNPLPEGVPLPASPAAPEGPSRSTEQAIAFIKQAISRAQAESMANFAAEGRAESERQARENAERHAAADNFAERDEIGCDPE